MPASPRPTIPSSPRFTASGSVHRIRGAALRKAETWLRNHESPRLHMLIIVAATGGAALLFSFFLLQLGLLSGAAVCAYVIWTAPVLFAEVLVDGVIMARIYRKMRIRTETGWGLSAIRRTWVPALLLVAFMAIAGIAMEHLAPGAHSIGAVVDHFRLNH